MAESGRKARASRAAGLNGLPSLARACPATVAGSATLGSPLSRTWCSSVRSRIPARTATWPDNLLPTGDAWSAEHCGDWRGTGRCPLWRSSAAPLPLHQEVGGSVARPHVATVLPWTSPTVISARSVAGISTLVAQDVAPGQAWQPSALGVQPLELLCVELLFVQSQQLTRRLGEDELLAHRISLNRLPSTGRLGPPLDRTSVAKECDVRRKTCVPPVLELKAENIGKARRENYEHRDPGPCRRG